MAPPQRRPRAPARSSRRGVATFVLGVGCLAVLAVTFALGMAAGRRWPDGLPLPGLGGAPAATATARTEPAAGRRSETRGLDKEKAKPRTETTPLLTFYHELTAPMASVPPPTRGSAKPERSEAKAAEASKTAARPAGTMSPTVETLPPQVEGSLPPSAAGTTSPATGESRFTVQVASFKVRAQAEALRARLTESGQDAYVSEGEVSGVPQYRVRVGSFATREEARDAAARFGGERQLSPYVTTR